MMDARWCSRISRTTNQNTVYIVLIRRVSNTTTKIVIERFVAVVQNAHYTVVPVIRTSLDEFRYPYYASIDLLPPTYFQLFDFVCLTSSHVCFCPMPGTGDAPKIERLDSQII
jgi:hypothetical protein